MPGTVISIENVSKYYRLGLIGSSTIREDLQRWWSRVRSEPDPSLRIDEYPGDVGKDGYIWALRDVSLEVAEGEVVGIIGRNGAGKSTLLKILSRVTAPTAGCVNLRGRIASLLEVGTGFHPELTGRENIFLNGAILGMRKSEIRSKLDEIVAFAEVERFIDTPVKRYSSGMYVRLAFAVAAHLDPEILVVDEVLAVGDVAFQKKCLGKMSSVASEGRTVLFVSHNMGAIQSLCGMGVMLKDGRVACQGRAGEAVAAYLNDLEAMTTLDLSDRQDRSGRGNARLCSARVVQGNADVSAQALLPGCRVRFEFEVDRSLPGLDCTFTIYDVLGVPLANFNSRPGGKHDLRQAGSRTFICEIENLFLRPGRYRVNAQLRSGHQNEDTVAGVLSFDVEEGVWEERPVTMSEYGRTWMPHRWLLPGASP